jgi:hypothetical protein
MPHDVVAAPTSPIVTLVPGTHAWSPTQLTGQWYHDGSLFRARLAAEQMRCSVFPWSTGLDGLLPWRKLHLWHATGLHLYERIVPYHAPEHRIPPYRTHVVTHSHGLQPALVAAAEGLYIHTLIDICGPVRHDVTDKYGVRARKNIGFWLHVHSDRSDTMQWLGGIGDGAFGITRPHPLANVNHYLPNAGHSAVLNEPEWLVVWNAWLDLIRKRDGHAAVSDDESDLVECAETD